MMVFAGVAAGLAYWSRRTADRPVAAVADRGEVIFRNTPIASEPAVANDMFATTDAAQQGNAPRITM